MKIHKLFLVGAMVGAMVVPTQAAVYGTLKQDMYFNIEGYDIVKTSGSGVSILDQDENNYLIRIDENNSDLVSKHFVKIQGTITKATTNAAIVEETTQNTNSPIKPKTLPECISRTFLARLLLCVVLDLICEFGLSVLIVIDDWSFAFLILNV